MRLETAKPEAILTLFIIINPGDYMVKSENTLHQHAKHSNSQRKPDTIAMAHAFPSQEEHIVKKGMQPPFV